jgi:hypothetical protein
VIATDRFTAIAIGAAASALTYLGGTIASWLRDQLSLILRFAAGAVVGNQARTAQIWPERRDAS